MNTIETTEETVEETEVEEGADEGAGEGEGNGEGTRDKGKKDGESKPAETDADRLARLQRQTNQARKKAGLDPVDFEGKKTATKKAPKNAEAPTELNYAERAFLLASGLKTRVEQDLAFKASQDTGKPIEVVIESKWFKEDLEGARTQAALPTNKNRSNNPAATDTVEYWLEKGKLPPPEQVKLRQQVVNAKIAKSKGGNNFTSNSVVGQA